ncbi:hypothetical protein K501DRAFT_270836 [Backusella circina FSU 941]|nr:hypothetical protein K501DRAFT_270836 [Backusella circina FSU 941]
MSVLITFSATIAEFKLQEVFVGPQVNITPTEFTVDSAKVFLQSEEVSGFKEAFNSCIQSKPDYLSPTTLDHFNDTIFMPVTVFTLWDTADQDGYDSNYKSVPKIGSLLPQTVAINLNLNRDLSKENVSLFQTAYESAQHNKDNESWKIINQVVYQTNTLIEDKPMKMPGFILQANLSKVANLVDSHLCKANQEIESNVKARFLNLYR